MTNCWLILLVLAATLLVDYALVTLAWRIL